MNNLEKLVLKIVADNPNGINHVGLVRACLERGYRHPNENFSYDLMQTVKDLARQERLVKSEETRVIQLGRCAS